MKCVAAQEMISDYVDGLLDAEQESALRSHLEACPDCRDLVHDFEAIVRQAKDLAPVDPSPLAWPKIVARVRDARQRSKRPVREKTGWLGSVWNLAGMRYVSAAALALVVIGGLAIGLKPWKHPASAKAGSVEFTVSKLREAQSYYEKAIRSLNEAVQSRKNGLDPQLAEVFRSNLKAMDQTIQACQAMINKDPDNVAARTYLLAAYQDKVAFLQQIMSVEGVSGPKKTETTL